MHRLDGIDFGDEWWRRIRGPTEEARGLPNEVYCSEAVFARTWCLAGRASAVAETGDVTPVEVAGLPLFMVRDNDGDVRIFHNVCPHRGARLVAEALSSCESDSKVKTS